VAAGRDAEVWQEILGHSLDCVHCGLCLPTCPTYRETGSEMSSPRGRIYLFRGVAEGRIDLSRTVADEAYLCLGCRACETACPSGVRFGSMLELARSQVEASGQREGPARRLERLVLRHLIPNRRRLHWLFHGLAALQWLGLDRLGGALLPRGLREVQAGLPRVPSRALRRPLPRVLPARGERRGRVGLFVGCVMSELFADVNAATADVLTRNGFDVVVPASQGCCGALHAHSGDADFAHGLARQNLSAFDTADLDAIVVNSAGCGAAMRDARHWLPGEADAFSDRVRDVSEFLDEQGLRDPPGAVEARVCYDDPCHLVHGQNVEAAPRRLLSQVRGLTLVAHEDAAGCCGAAGIYNLTHWEMSQAVLDRKLTSLAAADPDVIATGNPGCMMQLRAGVARAGLRARVLHPVQILAEAYGADSP